MVLIERRSCADRLEAELYERKLTEDLQATLSSNRPRLLPGERKIIMQEYYQNHREDQLEYAKEYRTQNHAHINEKFTCTTCSGRYTRRHMSSHCRSKKHQLVLSIPSKTIEATPSSTAQATATASPPTEFVIA